jgi:hypothetical protein
MRATRRPPASKEKKQIKPKQIKPILRSPG